MEKKPRIEFWLVGWLILFAATEHSQRQILIESWAVVYVVLLLSFAVIKMFFNESWSIFTTESGRPDPTDSLAGYSLVFGPLLFLIEWVTDADNNGNPGIMDFLFSLFFGPIAFWLLLGIPIIVLWYIVPYMYLFTFDKEKFGQWKSDVEATIIQRKSQRIVKKEEARRLELWKKEQEEIEKARRRIALVKAEQTQGPLVRRLAEYIFSDIRDYEIIGEKLRIEVFVNGNIRQFSYSNIYSRDIEDIEREMKEDKISPKPTTRRRYSRYHGGANDVGDSGSGLGDTMADDDG